MVPPSVHAGRLCSDACRREANESLIFNGVLPTPFLLQKIASFVRCECKARTTLTPAGDLRLSRIVCHQFTSHYVRYVYGVYVNWLRQLFDRSNSVNADTDYLLGVITHLVSRVNRKTSQIRNVSCAHNKAVKYANSRCIIVAGWTRRCLSSEL